jgi:hypothetical protein
MACDLQNVLKSRSFRKKTGNSPPDRPDWAKTMILWSLHHFGRRAVSFGIPPARKMPQKRPKLWVDPRSAPPLWVGPRSLAMDFASPLSCGKMFASFLFLIYLRFLLSRKTMNIV